MNENIRFGFEQSKHHPEERPEDRPIVIVRGTSWYWYLGIVAFGGACLAFAIGRSSVPSEPVVVKEKKEKPAEPVKKMPPMAPAVVENFPAVVVERVVVKEKPFLLTHRQFEIILDEFGDEWQLAGNEYVARKSIFAIEDDRLRARSEGVFATDRVAAIFAINTWNESKNTLFRGSVNTEWVMIIRGELFIDSGTTKQIVTGFVRNFQVRSENFRAVAKRL